MSIHYQQSLPDENMKVPQSQFIVRVLLLFGGGFEVFSAAMRHFSDSVHPDVESQVEPSMANSCWLSRGRSGGRREFDSQVFCHRN